MVNIPDLKVIYWKKFFLGALAILVALLVSPLARAAEVRVADNVFVVPDANAPSTTFYMIVKAGCRDEPHGHCGGLAHYLEHLVFLGRNADHKAVAIRFFPDAEANGFTTFFSTVFWQRFPKRPEGQTADLEKLLSFYTGVLQDLRVSDSEATRERDVVMQEYQMRYGRSPWRRLHDHLMGELYPLYPLGQDVLGTKEEIAAFTLDAAAAFRQTWYTPDNVVFVIHGPVEPEAIKSLAQTYLTPLGHRKAPERGWLNTLLDFSPLDSTYTAVERGAAAMFEFDKLVRFEEPDRARMGRAREVLAEYLLSTLEGGLQDALVDAGEIAKSVNYVELRSPAAGAMQLTIGLQPAEGVDLLSASDALGKYFADLAARGIDAPTLERLKKRIAGRWSEQEADPSETAQALVTWFASISSYEQFQQRRQALDAVTVDDVAALLRALAGPGRRVAGSLRPL